MKRLLIPTILMLLIVACGVPQQDYDVAVNQALALDSDLLHCQSGLTYCDATLEYTADQLSEAEGELRNTSILLSELQVENNRLAASLADEKQQLTDAKRELSQLTYTNQQLTGLMFCDGINRDWSVKSVSEALTNLDDTDQWDFRSGTFQNFRVWTNAAVRYVSVRATDDGEEYAFPYIIYPAEEIGKNPGIFNLTGQCWIFLDIPAIPITGTDA